MLTLTVLPSTLAICRLDPSARVPTWAEGEGFVSISRSAEALSIVCDQTRVPSSIKAEPGWRAFKFEDPVGLAQTGVLKQVLDPLADGHVSILVISTFDAQYVLVKTGQFEQAVTALTRFGHTVRTTSAETIEVTCGWRTPDGSRTTATYRAEIIEYDAARDRWLVRFTGVQAEDTEPVTRGLIEAQVGKWAYVPSEARRGMTLPLKYETLTGKPRWFYADDPRQVADRNTG